MPCLLLSDEEDATIAVLDLKDAGTNSVAFGLSANRFIPDTAFSMLIFAKSHRKTENSLSLTPEQWS